MRVGVVAASITSVLWACGMGGGVQGPPDGWEPPAPPGQPPPTGTRWQETPFELCGRETVIWLPVDETCGGTELPLDDYLSVFQAPMFRDGALVGGVLYAVDGTHLWSLDVSDPAAPRRLGLTTGLGHPIATAAHAGRLLVAGGDSGLLVVDVSDPAQPVRQTAIALPGPALAVSVDGDIASVAIGAAGVAQVDLVAGALIRTVPMPGFAASALGRDGLLYAAVCGGVVVADAATGELLGGLRLDPDAPAKGIELVGTTAFVAAGRYGAIAVDVSDPHTPALLGNCTLVDDPTFYASGVRALGDRLYVAGGEWGVLPIDVTDPATACAFAQEPWLDEPAALPGEACSSEPPWVVMPWRQSYSPPPPPPPGKDPVQVLPADGLLYAFGDARRIGARAVEVRATESLERAHVGRYDEPRRVHAVAAGGGRVLALGPAGGLFARGDGALLVRVEAEQAPPADAVAAVFLADGRWAAARADGELTVEALPAPIPLGGEIWPHGLASRGGELYAPLPDRLITVAADGSRLADRALPHGAALPPAVVAPPGQDGVVVAAPEWVAAEQIGGAGGLPPHEVFDQADILDPGLWRLDLPRRLLAHGERGLVEVVSFGGRAGLVLHGGAGPIRLELPRATYLAAAAAGDRVYLVSADRDRYRSQIVTIDLAGAAPALLEVQAFSGVALDLAVDGDRLYAADADRGLRVFERGAAGLIPLGVVDLEVRP